MDIGVTHEEFIGVKLPTPTLSRARIIKSWKLGGEKKEWIQWQFFELDLPLRKRICLKRIWPCRRKSRKFPDFSPDPALTS